MKNWLRKRKKSITVLIVLLVLNLLFWNRTLANGYTLFLYHPFSEVFSRITDLFPFCIGEFLMYFAFLLVVFSILFLLAGIFLRKDLRYRKMLAGLGRFFGCFLLLTLICYTFTWSIPIHNDLLKLDTGQNFRLEDLECLRNYLTEQMNRCAQEALRDENGRVIYDYTDDELIEVMQRLGETYPNLKGFYPQIKVALCTDFLEFMSIGGYTYPFSQEITVNRYSSSLYRPCLFTHEYSHHKGFYKESEGNFISYLALLKSDKVCLQYAAYYGVYFYVNDAYLETLYRLDPEHADEHYRQQPALLKRVYQDISDSHEEARKRYEQEANKDLEVFSEAAQEVADVGWSTQANLLQEDNYDGVVALLLAYYQGILYE